MLRWLMEKHQFAVGDTVRLTNKFGVGPSTSVKIVRLMPAARENLPPAYRVKALAEGHERMVTEDEISRSL